MLHLAGHYESTKLTIVMNFSVEEIHHAHSMAMLVFSPVGKFCI